MDFIKHDIMNYWKSDNGLYSIQLLPTRPSKSKPRSNKYHFQDTYIAYYNSYRISGECDTYEQSYNAVIEHMGVGTNEN